MKQLLITIAAVLLVGCGESQQSASVDETKPVDPFTEVPAKPPSTVKSQPVKTVTEAKAPDISIIKAVTMGNVEAVKQHLAAGTDVNEQNELGEAALHFLAHMDRKEITELLIASGANVNVKDNYGTTPLHIAAFMDLEFAALLITKKAAVNVINDAGNTALDWAIRHNSIETVNLLRKHGGKTGAELRAAAN